MFHQVGLIRCRRPPALHEFSRHSLMTKREPEHPPRPCPQCGREVRVVNERDAVVFYIRDHCGRRGAYSVPERPR